MLTQDMINEAVDDFDADKVSKMMDAVGWRWSTVIEDRAPSGFEIRKCCRYLCDLIKSEGHAWAGTGGIVARFTEGSDDGPYSHLELEFVGVGSEVERVHDEAED